MAVQICGYCGEKAHFTPIGVPNYDRGIPRDAHSYCEQSLNCDSCGRMSVFYVREAKGVGTRAQNSQMEIFWNGASADFWSPKWVTGQSFDDVPEHIAEAASEAHKIFAIDAVRSAVLMSRAVIEATCKDHDVSSGSLATKIDAMNKAGHINNFTKEVAHTIRTFGNDMAHGDFIVDLDTEDAREVLAFMDDFLQQVYQLKARLGRLKKSASARKTATQASP